MTGTSQRFIRNLFTGLLALVMSLSYPAPPLAADGGPPSPPYTDATQILELSRYLASTKGTPDAYGRILKAAFGDGKGEIVKVTAYEENEAFIYAVATMPMQGAKTQNDPSGSGVAHHFRRLIALNPSTFLIDDEFVNASFSENNLECLWTSVAPKVSGGTAEIEDASGKMSSEILFPSKATYRVNHGSKSGGQEGFLLQAVPRAIEGSTRLLQVLRVGKSDSANSGQRNGLITTTNDWKFTATIGGKVFTLTLPPPEMSAGTISISSFDGKTLIATRPFPSGILPHGPEGNRLLNVWDSDYRRPEPALWDIGRPADELQRVVEEGKIARCRVVDMCCGSGTDAIYLAGKGFDVTAIDVAPTALGLAMEKARKANVSVHWEVADILAPAGPEAL